MRLNSKTLLSLPVRTRSGQSLGKVASMDVDADTGKLAVLRVKTRGIVPGLLDQELSISWDQIVEITEKEVIVQDGTVPVGLPAGQAGKRALATASAAMGSAGGTLAREAAES